MVTESCGRRPAASYMIGVVRMFGSARLAMQRANEAYELARGNEVLLREAVTEFRAHSRECKEFREGLERDAAERRGDVVEWRRGLGARLDRQDRVLWGVLLSVLGGVLAFVGEMIVSGRIHLGG